MIPFSGTDALRELSDLASEKVLREEAGDYCPENVRG